MNVLVTGGAGYIGSSLCKSLALNGHNPIALDDLSRGNSWAVKWGPLYVGDFADLNLLKQIHTEHKIDCVFHLAASTSIAESFHKADFYFENNFYKNKLFIENLKQFNLKKLVFSSTCAVYGETEGTDLCEQTKTNPLSPYAQSKLLSEQLFRSAVEQDDFTCIIFRYFNVAGADTDLQIGPGHQQNRIINLIVRATLDEDFKLSVAGQNHLTFDGTCIRDYIHIEDINQAHLKSLSLLHEQSGGFAETINLGAGVGVSILQIIERVEQLTQRKTNYSFTPPQRGDAAQLIANTKKAENLLGYNAQSSQLDTILNSNIAWYEKFKELSLN